MKRIICILLLLFCIFIQSCVKFPSDKKMIDNFHKNKATFTKLVSMLDHDNTSLLIYAKAHYWDKYGNMSQNRLNEYRRLLDKAHLIYFISSPKRNLITFTYYYNDVSKSYVYTTSKVSPLENNLDKYSGKININVYRHIEGNWYLEYSE